MRKLRLVGKDIDVVVAAATGSTLEAAVNPVFMQHGITTRRVAVYCDGLLLSYLSTLAELGVEDEDQLADTVIAHRPGTDAKVLLIERPQG